MSSPDHEAVRASVVELLAMLGIRFGKLAEELTVILEVEKCALSCYRKGVRHGAQMPSPPPIPLDARRPRQTRDSQKPTPVSNTRKRTRD
jgi:hypothetical protein